VVHGLASDVRVKIKYDEYVRLHRIVTGLNARLVWEHLLEHGHVTALVSELPDEFHVWVSQVAGALSQGVAAAAARVEETFDAIVGALPPGWSRKEFAEQAVRDPDRGLLFLRLDGKDVTKALWQQARPAADWSPRTITEE
jgi:RNA ligase